MTTATVEGVEVDTRHWIGGERVKSESTFTDISPIDEQPIAEISAGSEPEVDAAVEAAQQAFPGWAATPPSERAELLRKLPTESTPALKSSPGSRLETTVHCCGPTGAV